MIRCDQCTRFDIDVKEADVERHAGSKNDQTPCAEHGEKNDPRFRIACSETMSSGMGLFKKVDNARPGLGMKMSIGSLSLVYVGLGMQRNDIDSIFGQ